MKIIVGLGNPEKKYQLTRHNVGWFFIDWLYPATSHSLKFHSQLNELTLEDKKVILQKPLTYMNESGKAVKELCDFYKTEIEKDLLIIQDEIDLPFGEIRLSQNSSAAGHNGIKNIIEHLGSQNFLRIRIGVESRTSRLTKPTDIFVLENFTSEEIQKLQNNIFPKVKNELLTFLAK